MHFLYTPYIIPLFIAGTATAWVAYYAWSRREVAGTSALAYLAMAAGIWTIAYALEIAGADLPTKVLWAKVQYLGITTVPLLWLVFCYNYFHPNKQFPHGVFTILGSVSLVTLVLVFTTESHGLVWGGYTLGWASDFSFLRVSHGPWFTIFWTYSILLVLIGAYFIIIRLISHKHGLYRGQIAALIFSMLAPSVGNLLYVTHLSEFDLTPFGFAISVVFTAGGIFRFQLINLAPLARDTVVEAMEIGMIVIDSQGRIADINRAAITLTGLPVKQIIHRPALEVLARWSPLTEKYQNVLEALDEISIGEGERQRWFELGISPLRNNDQTVIGRLLTLRDITVHRQVAERFRQLSRAVESSPASIVITDTDGRIQYVNPKFSAVTGYALQEVLGKNPRLLKTDQTPPGVHQQLWATITAGQEWHGEFCNQKKNGELYWETASISPIFDTSGVIINYVAVKEDITTARRLQERLQVQNKYLSILHEITLDLLNRRELDDLLQAIVNHAADLLGAPYGQIMLKEGENWVVHSFTQHQGFLLGDQAAQDAARLAWQAHDTGQPVILSDYSTWSHQRIPYDWISLHAIGMFPVMVGDRCVAVIGMGRSKAGQIFTSEETLIGILFSRLVGLVLDSVNLYDSAVREIAERKRTELLLQESEERYRQIVEDANDLICRTNVDGCIAYVNPISLRFFGVDRIEDIVGKNYLEFIVPEWRNKVRRFYTHQYLSGVSNTYFEFPITTLDGHDLWLGQNVQIIQEADQIVGFQAVARDITAIKRAQEALSLARDQAQAASHFKSDLLARVSHELRTPLFGILGYAELLNDNTLGPLSQDQAQAVETIVGSSHYLTALISDLMDQAQIEAKKLVLQFGQCSPGELLRNLEEMMSVLAQKKGLTLQTILEPEVPVTVYSDAQRLRQIMINLVSNAIKFTKQGEICVRMFQPNANQWAIQVSDTGIGIPVEAHALIFEPFHKVNSSPVRDNRGIGLGLSITKQLVDLMGGKITLNSEIGIGSTFTVILPINKIG